MSKVIVAGGSGFVGGHLIAELNAAGHEVVLLSRSSKSEPGASTVIWDAKTVGPWASELDGALAVYNLSGTPVDKKWTPEVQKQIRDSRVYSTRAIGEAIAVSHSRPQAWINASAIGFYGNRGNESLSESSKIGQGFLAETCIDWEKSMSDFDLPDVSQTAIRIGIVLGKEGGAFPILNNLAKAFLGGAVGSGKQYMSWIHVRDLARMMVWAIDQRIDGPVNGVAPNPVTNAEFMATLRELHGRPPIPPAPSPILKLATGLMGKEAEVLLSGAKVFPTVAKSRGFEFEFPDLRDAVSQLADVVPSAWSASK